MKVRLWKVIAGLLLVALLVGGGAMLYKAGYAQGVMSDVAIEALPHAEGGTTYMHPYYGMRGYHGHMGFFFFGRMFFGMVFFFLLFGLLFRGFGMRRHWMMHHRGYPGKGGPHWKHHGHPYWDKESDNDDEEGVEDSGEEESK